MPDYSSLRLIVLNPGDKQIFTCDGNGEQIEVLRDGVDLIPDGVFVDGAGGVLYGTLMGEGDFEDGTAMKDDGVIWRMALDGSDACQLVGGGAIRTPKQITADLAAGKLYFADREGMRIWRCDLDGGDLEMLVETGKRPDDERDQRRWCVGVAVDPARRQFYWTQKGGPDAGEGRIFRAGYDMPEGDTPDARSDAELLFDNLPEVVDLDLETDHGWLWWTDRGDLEGGNSVCRARLAPDGTMAKEHEVVLKDVGETIGSVIFHEENLIFCTSLTGELYRAALDGGDLRQIGKFKMLTGIAKLPEREAR